jgi:hypothetical protein
MQLDIPSGMLHCKRWNAFGLAEMKLVLQRIDTQAKLMFDAGDVRVNRTTTVPGTGHRVIAVRGAGAEDVRGDVLGTEPEQELELEGQVSSATGVYWGKKGKYVTYSTGPTPTMTW